MGLPNNALSSQAFVYPWIDSTPDPSQYVDYSLGGADIQNPLGGMQYQQWTFDTDGTHIFASSPGTGRKSILTPGGVITSIRACFDQNMYPFLCYLVGGQWSYYWFNAVSGTPVTSQLPSGVTSVVCALDDKRLLQASLSDVGLFYTLNNNFYYLRQRDRYTTAYLLKTGVNGLLLRAGMNVIHRMQFKFQAFLA